MSTLPSLPPSTRVRLTRVWAPHLVAQGEPPRTRVVGTVVRHDQRDQHGGAVVELRTAEGIELYALGEHNDHTTTVEVAR